MRVDVIQSAAVAISLEKEVRFKQKNLFVAPTFKILARENKKNKT